jgi:hypothetical protein
MQRDTKPEETWSKDHLVTTIIEELEKVPVGSDEIVLDQRLIDQFEKLGPLNLDRLMHDKMIVI